ncbi:MAG: hypothetical protein OXN83_02125, partial [Oligoflexia bacterium]|nr:hypothetical protein [Oligoflexia bacterium]
MRLLSYLLLLFLSAGVFSAQANSCEHHFSADNSYKSSPPYSKKFIETHSTKQFNPTILRRGDIRGIFLKDLDFGFVEIFAESLSQYLRKKTSSNQPHVLLAHDARIPSAPLSDLLIEKLLERGVHVDKIGLMPTPVAYYLMETHSLDAAVIITASHNPKEYIGFKTVLNSNYKTVNSAIEINRIILENNKEQKSGPITNIKAQTKIIDSASSYIEALKTEFNTLSFDSFVLDTSNGAGGPIAKKIFEAFDLNPHYINLTPDGAFPNHEPDPTKINNLKQLSQKVNETNSEFGIALDGDGDRIVIISADGKIIEADQYAYLFLPELAETQDSK